MSTDQAFPYATHLDIKFQGLSLVDVPALVRACTDRRASSCPGVCCTSRALRIGR